MIKVITRSDSYVLKCEDIHALVDNMVSNSGFWYYSDNLFVPYHEVVRVEKMKLKEEKNG